DRCLAPASWCEGCELQPATSALAAANGDTIAVKGLWRTRLQIKTSAGEAHLFTATFCVTDQITGVIGMDFLRGHNALWDMPAGALTLKGVAFQLRDPEGTRSPQRARTGRLQTRNKVCFYCQ